MPPLITVKTLSCSKAAMMETIQVCLVGTLFFCFAVSSQVFAQAITDNQSTKELLISAIQDWVGKEMNVSSSQINVMASDPRLIIKPCDSEYVFQFPFSNQNIVSTSCDSPTWHLNLRIEVAEKPMGLVFADDFLAGRLIGDDDVEEAFVQRDTIYEVEKSDVVGRGLKVSVQAGQRVRLSLLAEATVQYIALVSISEGTVITDDMYSSEEAPFRNLPIEKNLSKSVINGAKASRTIARGEALNISNILPSQTAVFATSIIARGNLLTDEFVQEQIFYGELPIDVVPSTDNLGRATALRQLNPGQPIRYSDVRPLAAVRKGETVTLTVTRGAITVSIDMEATAHGFIGDTVKLRNTESGMLVDAIITGPGRAERD